MKDTIVDKQAKNNQYASIYIFQTIKILLLIIKKYLKILINNWADNLADRPR